MVELNTRNCIETQLNKHRRKNRRKKILSVLGSIAVFCTTYALILPAITISDTAFCGIEEHQHVDTCYEKELICDSASDTVEHVHSDTCYELEKRLICTLEEGHTHTDLCTETERTLVCTLPEDGLHVHEDTCYEVDTVYLCDESDVHEHGENCWEEESVLHCTLTEDAVEHQHDDACYVTGALICKQRVHEHELQCFSNPDADVETAGDWEQTLPDDLTMNARENVIMVAESQLGYEESTENYIVNDENEKYGYSRYGAWFGNAYGDWCAMFASFCLHYAGVEDMPLDASCPQWIEELRQDQYKLYEDASDYIPQRGDLVFFDWDYNDSSDHVGLVADVILSDAGTPESVQTIEGNTGNERVEYVTYDGNSPLIMGYGRLPEAQSADNNTLVFKDEELTVTAAFDKNFDIPKDAVLKVELLPASKPEYTEMTKAISEELIQDDTSMLGQADLYHMAVVADGKNVEIPDDIKQTVSVEYQQSLYTKEEMEYASKLSVVTVEDEEQSYIVDQPKATVEDERKGITAFSFTSRGIQTFGVARITDAATGNFWKRIYSFDELANGDTIAIVTPEGNVALTYEDNTKAIPVDLDAVKGNEDYYYITDNNGGASLAENGKYLTSKFTVRNKKTNTFQLQNQGTTSQYLMLNNSGDNSVFGTSAANLTVTLRQTENTWTINSGSNYLWYNRPESLTSKSSTSNELKRTKTRRDMLILKLVNTTLQIPQNTTNSAEDKVIPTKPVYDNVTPRDELTGTEPSIKGLEKVTVNYASDQSTSDLEERFTGTTEDDGKVLTDKSVIYEDDDYGAFETYEDGTFGVTLSALGKVMANKGNFDTLMDVVIILDTSYSMINDGAAYKDENGNVRMVWAMKALNEVIDQIMEVPENRVGLVTFSDTSQVVLPLDHYTTTNKTYLDLKPDNTMYDSEHGRGNNFYDLNINSNVKNSSNVTPSFDFQYGPGYPNWEGTYTQSGIQEAANILLNNMDTTDGNGNPRQPVIILISDGGPTLCSSNYKNPLGGPIYGNSGQTAENDHDADHTTNNTTISQGEGKNRYGVNGYYTVLTAQYYKDLVGSHYDMKTRFGSVGIGIDTEQGSNTNKALHDNRYCRAVLDPTAEKVANATNTFDGWAHEGKQFKSLLDNTFNQQYVSIPNHTNGYTTIGSTYSAVPVYKNPYSDYSYADRYYNGKNTTLAEDLISYLQEIQLQEYNWVQIIEPATSIDIVDPIGAGMEVKAAPVLRFGKQNYQPTAKETDGNVTKYIYNYQIDYKDAYPENVPSDTKDTNVELDLSTIDVWITTTGEGADMLQTVKLHVPEEILPMLYTELYGSFYYEEYPVRLIYPVGLTEASIAECNSLSAGGEKVYYTNRWDNGVTATGSLDPAETNPFDFNMESVKKEGKETANPTGTIETSFTSSQKEKIVQELGNNGKLVITKESATVNVEKKWVGTETVPDSVKVYLLADEQVVDEVTLTAETDPAWKHTWKNLPKHHADGSLIQYTVSESYLAGYESQVFGPGAEYSQTTAKWTETSTITNGKEYVLKSNAGLLASNGNGGFKWVDEFDSSERPEDAAVWTVNNSAWQNKDNGKYINYNNDYFVSNGSSGNVNFSSGKLRASSGRYTYYFKSIVSSWNNSGKGDSTFYSNSALAFTAYEWKKTTTTETVPENTYLIVNTKTDDPPIDVNLYKKSTASDTYLSGAAFDLYQVSTGAGTIPIPEAPDAEANGKIIVHNIITDGETSSPITLSAANGTYYLVETAAPDGYQILEKPIRIEVKEGKIASVSCEQAGPDNQSMVELDDSGTIKITIHNHPGFVLPETGGPGTTHFILFGALLMIAALIILSKNLYERRFK